MNKDRVILNINPKPQALTTQGAKIVFVVPEEREKNCGLPRKSQKQPKVQIATMQETHPDSVWLLQRMSNDSTIVWCYPDSPVSFIEFIYQRK